MWYSNIEAALGSQISAILEKSQQSAKFTYLLLLLKEGETCFDRYVLCANDRALIKTDIAPHLTEFSVLGEGGGSMWVNSLQVGVRNSMKGTHRVVWESHSRGDQGRPPERSDL